MSNLVRHSFRPLFYLVALWSATALAESKQPANKLTEMFRLYYLPFSLDFKEGAAVNEIFPYRIDGSGEFSQLVHPEELQRLNSQWDSIREGWKKKSLLLTTPVALNETVRVTQHLTSSRIPMTRTAQDGLSIQDRIVLQNMLQDKPKEIKEAVLQMRFLKSFLPPLDEERFNFFIFSPSWCESSKEYRALLEAYFKQFSNSTLNFHSVIIDDPNEEIFDSRIFQELFPKKSATTTEIVPRFIAIQTIQGRTQVWEEGDALRELSLRFFGTHRGFLDHTSSLFAAKQNSKPKLDPKLSYNSK